MRFAVLDWLDCIVFESDDVLDCYSFILARGHNYIRGIYDYYSHEYLVLGDIPDNSVITLNGGNNGKR